MRLKDIKDYRLSERDIEFIRVISDYYQYESEDRERLHVAYSTLTQGSTSAQAVSIILEVEGMYGCMSIMNKMLYIDLDVLRYGI
jgi:hypothetical protein